MIDTEGTTIAFPGEQPHAPPARRPASVAALGVALPEEVVRNAPIADHLGVDEDWIVSRTGVRERRRAAAGESLAGLAARAGGQALELAGVGAPDVDLVLVATFTQDALLPNAAPLVAERLGAGSAGALDLGAACTGFLSGLAIASAQIESERADAVLVIGAELLSRVVDPGDRRTAALFGDGAGAALVNGSGPGEIGPVLLRSDGSGADCIRVAHEDRLIRMRGQDTFRAAVTRLSEATLEACTAAGLGLEDIDLFVYHQANARITRAVGDRLGLPAERVVDCIERYGNTSAASLPIALAEAERTGRLDRGARVLVATFAAGFTWGAGVIEW
jgi:3-oxoacyl-[acyl-carrier-protein] synthase-3